MSYRELEVDLASRLIARQNADGGWPSVQTGASVTEATAWALRALDSSAGPEAGEPNASASRGAVSWLEARQLRSGAWPISSVVDEPGASTAIAALALAGRSEAALTDRACAGAEWLLEHRGNRIPWYLDLYWRWRPELRLKDVDVRIRGWPWLPGLWGFAEPTATAVLVLRCLEGQLGTRAAKEAIEEGVAFLLDRTCPSGGWNYGFGTSKGEDLWPYADSTAFALIGLARESRLDAISMGFEALGRMLESNRSRLATALGVLALEAHSRDAGALRVRLAAMDLHAGPAIPTRALALSLMALRGDSVVPAACTRYGNPGP